jgi:RNA polymerase sigma factor (sigma-70 family)
MADPSLTNVLRYIRRLIRAAPTADCDDAQLLQQFVSRHDEAAFTALVGRHGPLVLAVCRNVLRDLHAAEDAFQATFLVLAKKAASIRQAQALGPWLHRVAYRIALAARAAAARRHDRERQTQTMAQAAPADLGSNDWQAVLHEEVNRLPDKYRVPVVLCYFEGKTHQEAANQLGWPLGTLKGRLARGRDLLRNRLARRGVALTVATWAGIESAEAVGGPLSATLLDATVKAAVRGTVSAPVAALAKTALRTLLLTRLKLAAFVLLGLATVALGAGAVLNRARFDGWLTQERGSLGETRPDLAQVRTDADGDPLPAGARLRLGSARFRHGDRMIAMAYAADGRTLLTAGQRGLVHTWDAKTGRPHATFRHAALTFTGPVAFSHDGDLSATTAPIDLDEKPLPPRKIILSRLSKNEVLRTLEMPGRGGNVHSVAFSGNGKYVAVASEDWITYWDCASGQEIRRFQVAGWHAYAETIALSRDGKLLVAKVAPPSQPIRVWEMATGKERLRLATEASYGSSFAFSGDGRVLASCYGREVSLWQPYTGKLIGKLIAQQHRTHDGNIEVLNHVAFSSDGKLVATTGNLGTVRLWDVASGKVRAVLRLGTGPSDRPWALAFAPDDRTLAVGGDEEIKLWDVAKGQRIEVTSEPIMGPCYAAVSPDGVLLATACGSRLAQLWDARTGKRIGQPIQDNGSWVEFSPDGTSLAIGSTLWNLATGEFITFRPGDQFAAFSPDQQFVVTADIDVTLSSIATRQVLWKDRRPRMREPAIFSIDGKLVAWGCEAPGQRYVVTLREAITGKEIGSLPCPDHCWAVAFCPDGQILAAAGENYIQVWDLSTKQVARQLEQAPKQPGRLGRKERRPLAFSPDGRILAAGDVNNSISLWDVVTGRELGKLRGHHGQILSLAFAADGQTLISGSDDTTALVWDLAESQRWLRR